MYPQQQLMGQSGIRPQQQQHPGAQYDQQQQQQQAFAAGQGKRFLASSWFETGRKVFLGAQQAAQSSLANQNPAIMAAMQQQQSGVGAQQAPPQAMEFQQ